MKNYIDQAYQTSQLQTHILNPAIHPLFYFSEGYLISYNVNTPPGLSFETLAKTAVSMPIDQQFITRRDRTIVLQSQHQENEKSARKYIGLRNSKKRALDHKLKKKPIQKQSRNVLSNLLRIFFKNILQMKSFDDSIQKNIEKLDLNISKQEFHTWLLSFNINYKNYIRSVQIKQIFAASDCTVFQRILLKLLREYLKTHAVLHCLTSKKIQAGSVGMHLSGLRQLYQDAISAAQGPA